MSFTCKSFRLPLLFFLGLLFIGCSSVSHYGPRPNFEPLEVGMSPEMVIETVGRPAMQDKKNDEEALVYGWDDPWDSVIGTSEEYFVLFKNDGLVQYGMLTKGAAENFGVWRAIDNAQAVAFPESR